MSEDVDEELKSVMGWLDSADAESDARESLTNGDIRLWGVRGIMLYIPGVENDEKKIVQNLPIVDKHGFRVIRGTGDHLINKERPQHNSLMRSIFC